MSGIERKRESQRIHQCLSSVSDVALLRLSTLSFYPAPTFDLAGESLVLRRIRRRFLQKINRFERVAERPHARCGDVAPTESFFTRTARRTRRRDLRLRSDSLFPPVRLYPVSVYRCVYRVYCLSGIRNSPHFSSAAAAAAAILHLCNPPSTRTRHRRNYRFEADR